MGLRVRSLGPTPMRGVSQGECYKAHRRDQQRYAGRTRGSREMARITSHGCEVAQAGGVSAPSPVRHHQATHRRRAVNTRGDRTQGLGMNTQENVIAITLRIISPP